MPWSVPERRLDAATRKTWSNDGQGTEIAMIKARDRDGKDQSHDDKDQMPMAKVRGRWQRPGEQ